MRFDLELGRQVLTAQPFSALLGAELLEFTPGRTVLAVPLREELLQQNGLAHGGLVAYLVDNAVTFAAGAAVGPHVLTAEVKVNYLAGARGSRVEARAEVVSVTRRLVTARCEVYDVRDAGEQLCAVGLGSVARVAPDED